MKHRERPLTVREMQAHIEELGRAFRIGVQYITDVTRSRAELVTDDKGVIRAPRTIGIVKIEHDAHYAIALHELGHHIAPDGFLESEKQRMTATLKLHREEAAWQQAQYYALNWTTAMEQAMQIGLESYRLSVRQEKELFQRYGTTNEVEIVLKMLLGDRGNAPRDLASERTAPRTSESMSDFLKRRKR